VISGTHINYSLFFVCWPTSTVILDVHWIILRHFVACCTSSLLHTSMRETYFIHKRLNHSYKISCRAVFSCLRNCSSTYPLDVRHPMTDLCHLLHVLPHAAKCISLTWKLYAKEPYSYMWCWCIAYATYQHLEGFSVSAICCSTYYIQLKYVMCSCTSQLAFKIKDIVLFGGLYKDINSYIDF
jgi:hypothetical protein